MLRRNYSSLALGDLLVLHSEGPHLIVCKIYFDEIIVVAINNSGSSVSLPIQIPMKIKKLNSLINNSHYSPDSSSFFKVEIEPYSNDFLHAEF